MAHAGARWRVSLDISCGSAPHDQYKDVSFWGTFDQAARILASRREWVAAVGCWVESYAIDEGMAFIEPGVYRR